MREVGSPLFLLLVSVVMMPFLLIPYLILFMFSSSFHLPNIVICSFSFR